MRKQQGNRRVCIMSCINIFNNIIYNNFNRRVSQSIKKSNAELILKSKMTNNKIGSYRWRICALLFFAATVNYIDRQVLGILAPDIQKELSINEIQYGWIITAFQISYAIGLFLSGRILDKIGNRLGYSIAVTIWSIAAMAHALARSFTGFVAARFSLALGESANFPASIKTISEWFPKKERALATGIFNSGTNVGAVIAPVIVTFVAARYGWQWAFIVTGAIGFLWIPFWLKTYKKPAEHPKLSKAELEYINTGNGDTTTLKQIPWKKLLPYRQTWAICIARFMTDPIWWFFLYWIPKYLNKTHGLNLSTLGIPLVVIYSFSVLGSIGGGWLSSYFIRKGKSVNFARKTTMFVLALLVMPVFFTSFTKELWFAILFLGMATAAHQGWSANVFTLVSDIFPSNSVGTLTGLTGFFGSVGGILLSLSVGYILEFTGSYYYIFLMASLAYICAWIVLRLLIPKIEPLKIDV
jgi:MFS transporter, ACS family, hexuronate transporter